MTTPGARPIDLTPYPQTWAFTPLDGKKPLRSGWQAEPPLSRAELAQHHDNIGLRTGQASGVVVVDIDDLDALENLEGALPQTVTVETGGGGRHYYYAYDKPLKNSASKLAPHVDVRADGGQVVFPGSVHPETGRRYEWLPGHAPADIELAPLPPWIVERLTAPASKSNGTTRNGATPRARAALRLECLTLRNAPEGTRNDTLNRAAFSLGQLVASGELDRATVAAELTAAAEAAGLDSHEIEATLNSGLRSGEREPRINSPRKSDPVQCDVNVATLADVEPEEIQWLWPGRIARGKINLLDGDPGVGKSMLTHAFAAAVSRGMAIDSTTRTGAPGKVVLLSAEDGLADTIRPRLEAAGADLTRVVAITGIRCDDGTERPVVLPNDVVPIEQHLDGAALIVVDPLMAFLSGDVNSHRDQDIRRVLHTLKLLAERTGAAILIVRHLNKTGGGNAKYRGGGSIGIVGAARCAMLAAVDPEDASKFVLAVSKCNVAAPQPSWVYQIVPDDRTGSARVQWLGESGHSADDLVAPRDDDRKRPASKEAENFARAQLANGSMLATELYGETKAVGIAIPTLKKALRSIRAVADRERIKGGRWFWTLESQVDQPSRSTSPLNDLDLYDPHDLLTPYQVDQVDQVNHVDKHSKLDLLAETHP